MLFHFATRKISLTCKISAFLKTSVFSTLGATLTKNVTKIKKVERKIASVCRDKTIQFVNKWTSTELKITV